MTAPRPEEGTAMTTSATTAAGAGRDAHGNPMSGDATAVQRYDRAVDRLLHFAPDLVEAAGDLAATGVPMGEVLNAYLQLMSTDPVDLPGARQASAALAGRRL